VGEGSLRLFRVAGGRVQELALQHSGSLVAHAFSPDSARLALVTDLNRDPGAARDTRLSVLELAQLEAEPGALSAPEAFPIQYELGLGWADAATLEFIGLSPLFETAFTAQVLHLSEAGLPAAELVEVFYPFDPADTIRWFQPLPGGLFVMSNALLFINAEQTVSAVHLRAQALSPTYDFSAHTDAGRLLLHAPGAQDMGAPSVQADGCDRLLAWSEDGRSLACVFEGKPVSFALTEGTLLPERLDTPWSAGGAQRSALSRHGSWLALADAEHGLFLLSRGAPPPAVPLLASVPGETGWDFAFSGDERQLWMQQGRRLWLALLGAGEARARLLSEAMPAPPPCEQNGLPLPDEWCGAPRLHGNVALRGAGRYLGFADAAGALAIIDMAVPERRIAPSAQLSPACSKDCIVFQ
jgi:hypothetical protein